ncbi:MAG: hypothetical protein AMXMBFR83_24880 [Phycisphaerae bacterium]
MRLWLAAASPKIWNFTPLSSSSVLLVPTLVMSHDVNPACVVIVPAVLVPDSRVLSISTATLMAAITGDADRRAVIAIHVVIDRRMGFILPPALLR